MIVDESLSVVDQNFNTVKNIGRPTKLTKLSDMDPSNQDLLDTSKDHYSSNLQNSQESSLISGFAPASNLPDKAFMDERRQKNINTNIAWEFNSDVLKTDATTSAKQDGVEPSKQMASANDTHVGGLADFETTRNFIENSQLELSCSTSCSSLSSNCEGHSSTRSESPIKENVTNTSDKNVTKSRHQRSTKNKTKSAKRRSLQRASVKRSPQNDFPEIFPFGEGDIENSQRSPEMESPLAEESTDKISPRQKRNSGGFPFREVEPTVIQHFPFEDAAHDRSVEKIISPSTKHERKQFCFDELLSCLSDPFREITEDDIIPINLANQKCHDVADEDYIIPTVAKNSRTFIDMIEEEIIPRESEAGRGFSEHEDLLGLLERPVSDSEPETIIVSDLEDDHSEMENLMRTRSSDSEPETIIVSDLEDDHSEIENLMRYRSSSEESLGSVSSLEELPLDERIQNVNRAFEWVRAELLAMRSQDITLKIQFDSLRQEIRTMWEEQEEYNNYVIDDVIEETEENEYIAYAAEKQEIVVTAHAVSKNLDMCKALREDSGYHSDTPSQSASDSTGGVDDKPQTHALVTAYYQPLPTYATVEQLPTRKARHSGKCVFEIVL